MSSIAGTCLVVAFYLQARDLVATVLGKPSIKVCMGPKSPSGCRFDKELAAQFKVVTSRIALTMSKPDPKPFSSGIRTLSVEMRAPYACTTDPIVSGLIVRSRGVALHSVIAFTKSG